MPIIIIIIIIQTTSCFINFIFPTVIDRFLWSRGIRLGPAAARFLGYEPMAGSEEFY